MKSFSILFVSAIALTLTSVGHAQAYPTATRAGAFQIGVGGSFVSADYGEDYPKGVTAFGNFALTRRLGIEADAHYTRLSTPDNIGEQSYLAGARYSLVLEDRANAYVKVLGGVGRLSFESPGFIPHTDNYGVVAGGAGIEYRASSHINIRAIDVEYQSWPGFPTHGLTPFVTTIGVAWVH